MSNETYIRVQYKEELKVGDSVRVFFTGHKAKISKVVDCTHCLCYHIEPRDPKDFGGNWYFSHQFLRNFNDNQS